MRKGLGLVVAIALSVWLFQPSTASACWLCKIADGAFTCDLIIGETGGTDCFINCKSNGVCFCRTLGLCAGTDGCGGSPCPTIHGQVPSFLNGSSTDEPVWLTRELYDEVEAASPDAALLLSSLASDPDALSVGLRDRIPFQNGESKGMMSVPSGRKDKPRIYRYEASVIPMDGGVSIHIKVLDHPSLRGLDAQVWNGVSGTYVELRDKTGPSRRIDL